nr:hypothetical protein [Tanacetum cinerariifolium]
MLQELKSMFEKQAEVERFDLIQTFHACKQQEGKLVAAYVLQMKGYVDQLERLGYINPKKKSLKAKGKGKANGKRNDKQVYIHKPKNLKPSAKEHPAKDDTCHHCKEVGHWKGNCLVYLAELLKKKKQVGFASSSSVFIIELFSFSNKSWVYETGCGNAVRAQVEAIGSFDLVMPNSLVICLDNCHYAPFITRVSKNNVFYFNAIHSNGIYETDMHDLVPNDNSIYNVTTKRARYNLDSTYLWHCRLAHTSKKRIEKLQQEELFKSKDDESFDQCVSCLSGKMTRKSFPHCLETAIDLLGIIHSNVCGLLRHVSRQGASYFITFTNDYSRYGYVYLLKHKHETAMLVLGFCYFECLRTPLVSFLLSPMHLRDLWNGAHVGYNCPAQVLYFQTLPSFSQQYPCCEDCEGLPEADHCQSPQYTVNHPIFNAHNDLLNSQNKIMEQMTSMCEMVSQLIQKKQKEKQIQEDQAANARYWKILACYDDDDNYNFAVTPNEPIDSLIMGDEHLNTISATESDELIKSSVENLVPNPSESEGKNKRDMPSCFTTFSNILFDADYESDSNQHHFNAESDLIESMLNHDSSIIPSSSKIDSLLDEFAGELTLLKSIPPGIDETDCHPENENRLIERLLYDNSSPRPPEEFVSENSYAEIESFSPSPISIKDSDYLIEEMDLYCTPDDPMPPSIEDDDDDDSERDIPILEELLDNYSLSLPVNESFYFDIPSFSRPPAKPPDGDTGILNIKMMGDISDQKVPMPRLMITRVSNQEKSPDLLSHRSLENFQLSAKRPMMIHGKNIPILNVTLFHFYPH